MTPRSLTLLTAVALAACTNGPTGPALPDCDARAALTNADFVGGLVLESGSCWMVDELLTLDDGTVTVEDGVSIHFATGTYVDVRAGGTLRLAGTEDAVIELGSPDPLVAWRGIRMDDSQGTANVWEHVVIHNAGADRWNGADYSGAAVYLDGGTTLTMGHVIVRDSRSHGLVAADPELVLDFADTTFEGNDTPAYLHPEVGDALGSETVFSGNTNPWVRVVFSNNNTVETDRTWSALTVPYRVEDRFYVDGSLTLAPGVVVEMAQEASVRVNANAELVVVGTEAEPVVLRGAEALRGFWQGISIGGLATFDHAEISHAAGDQWSGFTASSAAIYMQDVSAASISNTTFTDNEHYGLWASVDAELDLFASNTFTDNGNVMYLHPDRVGELSGTSTVSGNDDDRIHVVFSNNNRVSVDATWPNLGVPYYAADRFYVDAALTLAAGVTVEFSQDIGMHVEAEGSLHAAGTSSDPVALVGAVADADGYWKGLRVESDDSANQLENTVITDAGSSQWTGDAESTAAIYLVDGATIGLTNVEIGPGGGYGLFYESTSSSATCSGVTFTSLDGAVWDDDNTTVLAGC